LLALRKKALLTIEASAAWRVVKTHDAIAGHPLGYATSNRDHGTSKLVTQNLRWLYVSLENFLDVGATNAASGDFDKHFTVADFRNGNFFDSDDTFVPEDTGAHYLRDWPMRVQGFCCCSGAAHVAETSSTFG
jgi:hypothetical protein